MHSMGSIAVILEKALEYVLNGGKLFIYEDFMVRFFPDCVMNEHLSNNNGIPYSIKIIFLCFWDW